jgi:hypothetical protein
MAPAQPRIQDVICMKAEGAPFTMAVVMPRKPNKATVVFMVSAAGISDHSMFKSFMPDIEESEAIPGGGHDRRTSGPGVAESTPGVGK